MTIKRITSKARKFRFLVYDLEWKPGTLEIRLIGVYDGSEYRCYTTIESFLKGELNARNRGSRFYAHAGGLADVQFVFDYFVQSFNMGRDRQTTVRAAFSGSSAISVHVGDGHNSYHFLDSFWLLRVSLAKIGKWIGLDKGDPWNDKNSTIEFEDLSAFQAARVEKKKKAWYSECSLDTLIDYNRRDCEVLWKAIDNFQDLILSLGGQMQATLASTAMQLFRRKYLTQEIETSWQVNFNATKSYMASRVEVFEERATDSYYMDINSSFPFAMLQPQPGNLIATHNRSIPKRLTDNSSSLYCSLVDIRIPETYLPPLPFRTEDKRVFFPIGKMTGWYDCNDLRLLERTGGKILRVYETMEFAPFTDLGAYASDIYALRKAGTTDFEKQVLKLLLNALYGKFAESSLKTSVLINPSAEVLKGLSRETNLSPIPGVWMLDEEKFVPHAHVPIASHITSIARENLYNHLADATDFHYCDTDGFSTADRLVTGPNLGQLKLEMTYKSSQFIAPKVYRIDDKVKAKGFSLSKNKELSLIQFQRLLKGKELEVERMIRIRENLNRFHSSVPIEKVLLKRLQHITVSKRFHYPDGSTRPWDTEELP